MLRANNPEIDFETLNRRIAQQLEEYRNSADASTPPEFDPVALTEHVLAFQKIPLAELLALEDEAFIQQAYHQVLGRPADSAGLNYYLAALRAGEEKTSILAALRYSPEGKINPEPMAGLKGALLKRRLLKLPVAGKIFATLFTLASIHPFRRFVNARFNHFLRLTDQHTAALQDLESENNRLKTRQAKLESQLDDILLQLANKDQQIDLLNKHLSQYKLRLTTLENRPSAPATQPDTATTSATSTPVTASETPVEDAFYAAFEEHFRGSRETILERLNYYVPILKDNAVLNQSGLPIADIGCGRGEWLNLLRDCGYQPIGIDLNRHNVDSCIESGHQALVADGLQWLQEQPDNSLAAISSFHVIEHLTFAQLNLFLNQALRVLAPGGLIILETPNPENLITGATHFYTDPTHLHPLPPAFSEFMLNYKGFAEITLHRLNPIPDELAIQENSEVARRCNQLFYGAQDYAVVACKPTLDQ